MNLTEFVPTEVGALRKQYRAGVPPVTAIVTSIGTCGAAPRLTLMVPCMLAPTVVLPTVMVGAVTVAEML